MAERRGGQRDAERVRAHRDRGRQGRPCRQALSDLDGVQLAEDLAGPYDLIARVQAPGLDQLGRLVVSRIQVVDGVTRTLTCMVIQR
ncbi:MAG: Lrp/AsnC ligand binding domain-containing protein [Actinomycetes bacterium]